VDRRARLEPVLAAYSLDATWVTAPDAEDLSRRLRWRYYRRSRIRWRRRAWITNPIAFRGLSPREIAITISHIQTYETIARQDEEWALIFEDDAVLVPDFAARFDEYFAHLPADADMVFLGDCCGLRVADLEPGRTFYRKDHPATKCTDSYLIRRSAATTLAKTIVPFALPIDFELNYQLKLHDLCVYWLEPPLVTQGSQAGLYESTRGRSEGGRTGDR
jgi:glycosyl transferase, family 25